MAEEIFNSAEMTHFKRKFNHQLEPIKVMLVHRKEEMNRQDWVDFVHRTEESIIRHPDQFLEKDLPERRLLEHIVTKIFDEFLHYELSD